MDYGTTVDVIKSCIVSVKGGLPINSLPADFKDITGEDLNPQRLGYKSLEDLLISIEGIYLKGNLLIVKDKKTEHLSKLVSKQKGQTKIKAAKKSNPPSFTDSRLRHAVGMRKGPPKVLREQARKIEAEVHRLLPTPPTSNMAAKTAFTAKMNEYSPSTSAPLRQENSMSNLSLFGSSNASVAGRSVRDERLYSIAGALLQQEVGMSNLSLSGSSNASLAGLSVRDEKPYSVARALQEVGMSNLSLSGSSNASVAGLSLRDEKPYSIARALLQQEISTSNLSLSGSSNASLAGLSVKDEKPSSIAGAGRGRGRARSTSYRNVESPGGLSETSSWRSGGSPDIRSVLTSGTCSTSSRNEDDREPILLKHQLIGEGLLNKVSSLVLGIKTDAESRLCSSTLDIATCLKKLKRTTAVSDKVILMLGLTDIMKGKDLDTLKSSFLELLEYLRTQAKQIVVLTLPVPICVQKMSKPRNTLLRYNEWLLSVKQPRVCVVDLAPYTQNKNKETLEFLCEGQKLDPWNETACWALIEALFFSKVRF